VRRARIFDRCAPKGGIEPFDQLVEQFMSAAPYAKAQRVFLVIDNGSAHRGQRSIDRLQGAWPNLIVVHTPIHASWLNQAEIYLGRAAQGSPTPTTSTTSARSKNACSASSAATRRSPSRSSGSSPAVTSTGCWSGSTRPPRNSLRPVRRNHPYVKATKRQRASRPENRMINGRSFERRVVANRTT
jgi:hypothetical protein